MANRSSNSRGERGSLRRGLTGMEQSQQKKVSNKTGRSSSSERSEGSNSGGRSNSNRGRSRTSE